MTAVLYAVVRHLRTTTFELGFEVPLLDAVMGYRAAALRVEEMWRVVEDATAPEDARVGAASVLLRTLDDEGRKRVRIAAQATASPRVRVALESVGNGDSASADAALDAFEDRAETREQQIQTASSS